MLETRATVRSINGARKEGTVEEEEKKDEEEGVHLVGEGMQDTQDMNVNPSDNLTLEERES